MKYIYIDENKKIEEFNLDTDLIKIEKRNGKDYAKEYKIKALNLINIMIICFHFPNRMGESGHAMY